MSYQSNYQMGAVNQSYLSGNSPNGCPRCERCGYANLKDSAIGNYSSNAPVLSYADIPVSHVGEI